MYCSQCYVEFIHMLQYTPGTDLPRVDVMLIIDNSMRMQENVSAINNFVDDLVSGFQLSDNKTRVGVIAFNKTYQWVVSST